MAESCDQGEFANMYEGARTGKEQPDMTSDPTTIDGRARTALVEFLVAVGVAVIVAVVTWFGWVYFLDPVDGDPTDVKTLAYVMALVTIVGLGAFLARAPWVGLLAPFAMANAVLWGAAQDPVTSDGLQGVGAEFAAWGAFIPALFVGALGVLLRVRGNVGQLVRGRDVVAALGCVVAGRILMALAP